MASSRTVPKAVLRWIRAKEQEGQDDASSDDEGNEKSYV